MEELLILQRMCWDLLGVSVFSFVVDLSFFVNRMPAMVAVIDGTNDSINWKNWLIGDSDRDFSSDKYVMSSNWNVMGAAM